MSAYIQTPSKPGDRYYVVVRAAGSTRRIPADTERSAKIVLAMTMGRGMMAPCKNYQGRVR